jgi:hypothetical protein
MPSFFEKLHRLGIHHRGHQGRTVQRTRRRQRLTLGQYLGHRARPAKKSDLTEKVCQRGIRSYVRPQWMDEAEQKQRAKRERIYGSKA